jgi:cytochrome P450
MFVAGTLVEAGSDTTRNQNNCLVAAAATDMSWVHRLRKELDSVCGSNAERLPTWTDYEKLPLVQATVKEVMRWRPNIADTGFPHVLTEDCEYEGYNFEKGTILTWNAWHSALSPKEYEDPLSFKPERFLNEHLWDTLEGQWGFGAGNNSFGHSLTTLRTTRLCGLECGAKEYVYCIL